METLLEEVVNSLGVNVRGECKDKGLLFNDHGVHPDQRMHLIFEEVVVEGEILFAAFAIVRVWFYEGSTLRKILHLIYSFFLSVMVNKVVCYFDAGCDAIFLRHVDV